MVTAGGKAAPASGRTQVRPTHYGTRLELRENKALEQSKSEARQVQSKEASIEVFGAVTTRAQQPSGKSQKALFRAIRKGPAAKGAREQPLKAEETASEETEETAKLKNQ